LEEADSVGILPSKIRTFSKRVAGFRIAAGDWACAMLSGQYAMVRMPAIASKRDDARFRFPTVIMLDMAINLSCLSRTMLIHVWYCRQLKGGDAGRLSV
jgi:hypothetical protein